MFAIVLHLLLLRYCCMSCCCFDSCLRLIGRLYGCLFCYLFFCVFRKTAFNQIIGHRCYLAQAQTLAGCAFASCPAHIMAWCV